MGALHRPLGKGTVVSGWLNEPIPREEEDGNWWVWDEGRPNKNPELVGLVFWDEDGPLVVTCDGFQTIGEHFNWHKGQKLWWHPAEYPPVPNKEGS